MLRIPDARLDILTRASANTPSPRSRPRPQSRMHNATSGLTFSNLLWALACWRHRPSAAWLDEACKQVGERGTAGRQQWQQHD